MNDKKKDYRSRNGRIREKLTQFSLYIRRVASASITPLGSPLSDLVFRFFGLTLYLTFLDRLHKRSVLEFLEDYPLCFASLCVLGVSLIAWGGRIIILVPMALCGWLFLYEVTFGPSNRYLGMAAAEYPLYAFVPTFSVALIFAVFRTRLHRTSDDSSLPDPNGDLAAAFLPMFRITLLTTLAFVSFHKINADFFNPGYSCEAAINEIILKEWSLPFLSQFSKLSSPLLVVLVEGPIPIILLLLWRKVGIVFVTVLFSFVNLTSAPAITMSMIGLSLSFLNRNDFEWMMKRRRLLLALWIMATAIILPLSKSYFEGGRPWYQYGIHQSASLLIVVFVGAAQFRELLDCFRQRFFKKGSAKANPTRAKSETPREESFLLGPPGLRKFLIVISLLLLLNGFSPYLGLKFEYSFSMLSNLRVDNARWNHFIIPQWIRIRKNDPFIHVSEVNGAGRLDDGGKLAIKPDLYSPLSFREIINRYRIQESQKPISLQLKHAGVTYRFEDALNNPEFEQFLSALPRLGKLFQKQLRIEGPQTCQH